MLVGAVLENWRVLQECLRRHVALFATYNSSGCCMVFPIQLAYIWCPFMPPVCVVCYNGCRRSCKTDSRAASARTKVAVHSTRMILGTKPGTVRCLALHLPTRVRKPCTTARAHTEPSCCVVSDTPLHTPTPMQMPKKRRRNKPPTTTTTTTKMGKMGKTTTRRARARATVAKQMISTTPMRARARRIFSEGCGGFIQKGTNPEA